MVGAGAVGEAALVHRADTVIDHFHMVLGQGRVVIVGHEDALAAHGVIRGQLLAQDRVLDLLLQVAAEQPLVHLHGFLEGGETQGPGFIGGIDAQPVQGLGNRRLAQYLMLQFAVGAIRFGNHMGSGALEQLYLAGHLGHFRHELNGAGTGAYDGHGLAGQVHVVVPAGTMEMGAAEILDTGQRRVGGLVELAGGGDQHPGGQGVAIGERQLPDAIFVTVVGLGHFGVEADVPIQVVLARTVLLVGEDFLLRCEAAAPGVMALEGKRIQMRGHIAGGAGVGVVTPAATHVVAFFNHQNILFALGFQANGHAESAEAGTDNHHVVGHLHGKHPDKHY